jgi:hypothetical protein
MFGHWRARQIRNFKSNTIDNNNNNVSDEQTSEMEATLVPLPKFDEYSKKYINNMNQDNENKHSCQPNHNNEPVLFTKYVHTGMRIQNAKTQGTRVRYGLFIFYRRYTYTYVVGSCREGNVETFVWKKWGNQLKISVTFIYLLADTSTRRPLNTGQTLYWGGRPLRWFSEIL